MYGGIDQGSIPCMGIKLNREKRHMFVLQVKVRYCRCLAPTALRKRSSGRQRGLPGRSSVIYEPHAGYLVST